MDPIWEPEGELITSPEALKPTSLTSSPLLGSHSSLIPLSNSHANALYNLICGAQNSYIWKYIAVGPFLDLEPFSAWINILASDLSIFTWAIVPTSSPSISQLPSENEGENKVLGIVCLSNIAPQHRAIEIGVIFSSLLQRTTAATECIYLVMKHCFEDLGYLRIEWKCNNANEPSKRAAVRLGFVREGLLRRHMVVKERTRDTALYSVIKEDWNVVGKSLEMWLKEENFDERRQRRKLEEVRGEVIGKV